MTESLMDRVREILLFVAAIIAVFSFILAAYEGANQRVPSATFLGGLAIACTFLVFMPQLEVFKVWGIEARLSKTLDRAEEILGKLTRLSAISARASYLTIAWGNRLGAPSAKDRQVVLDDIDMQITDLKVSSQERAIIVRPWVDMIRADFFFLFTGVVREFAVLKSSDLTAKIHATHSQEATDASMAHSALITPWSQKNQNFDPAKRLEGKSLSDVIDEYMPSKSGWLSEKEIAALAIFKQEIIRLNADCEKKGGYTSEAADYYDTQSKAQKEKAKELWNASQK